MSAGNRESNDIRRILASKKRTTRRAALTALLTVLAIIAWGCEAGETLVSQGERSTLARAEGPHTPINSTIGIGVGRSSTTIYGLFYEAELRVAPAQGLRGHRLILENTGDGGLGYGSGYTLERRQGSAWFKVPDVGIHHLILLSLPPGKTAKSEAIRRGTHDQRVVNLQPGWYRITKDVLPQWDGPWPEGTAAPDFNVTAIFEVTG